MTAHTLRLRALLNQPGKVFDLNITMEYILARLCVRGVARA